MDRIALTATSPLEGLRLSVGDNRIAEQTGYAVVSIAIPQGGEAALVSTLKAGWSLDLPDHALSSVAGDARAVRTAPDQLLLIFPHDAPDASRVVQDKLQGTGYTTDQTDGWVQVTVAGPGTAAALERLSPIDLSPETFPIHAAARTVFEHMGVLVIRTGEGSFLLLSAASSAGSFLHAVKTSFDYTA